MPSQSFREFFGLSQEVTVRFNVTNVCNINCTHCDNDAHLPFAKNGELIHRRKALVASVGEIDAFCSLMAGVGEADPHLLTGGEVTVLPIATIHEYIDVLHRYGRKIGMRTNGFNVCGIAPEKLQLLDCIYLGGHGINHEAIDTARIYLARHFTGTVVLEETLQHRNLRAIVRHGHGALEQALACNHLLGTLTVMPPFVLPCCNTWALMNALNSASMMDTLTDAGWVVHNPDLRSTLKNWRDTLPEEFLQNFCMDSCYMTTKDPFPHYPIEPNTADRVLRRIPAITVL